MLHIKNRKSSLRNSTKNPTRYVALGLMSLSLATGAFAAQDKFEAEMAKMGGTTAIKGGKFQNSGDTVVSNKDNIDRQVCEHMTPEMLAANPNLCGKFHLPPHDPSRPMAADILPPGEDSFNDLVTLAKPWGPTIGKASVVGYGLYKASDWNVEKKEEKIGEAEKALDVAKADKGTIDASALNEFNAHLNSLKAQHEAAIRESIALDAEIKASPEAHAKAIAAMQEKLKAVSSRIAALEAKMKTQNLASLETQHQGLVAEKEGVEAEIRTFDETFAKALAAKQARLKSLPAKITELEKDMKDGLVRNGNAELYLKEGVASPSLTADDLHKLDHVKKDVIDNAATNLTKAESAFSKAKWDFRIAKYGIKPAAVSAGFAYAVAQVLTRVNESRVDWGLSNPITKVFPWAESYRLKKPTAATPAASAASAPSDHVSARQVEGMAE